MADIWTELTAHADRTKNRAMLGLFDQDEGRADRFSARLGDMLLDYSKTNIDDAAMSILPGTGPVDGCRSQA